MPRGAATLSRPISIRSWPAWPAHASDLGGAPASAPARQIYEQMAAFANRSLLPMRDLEARIADIRRGRAGANDLYQAAKAAKAATEDERDALMGLVLPPSVRSNPAMQEAWHEAQLASLAKVSALSTLVNNAGAGQPWEDPAYLKSLSEARARTETALQDARQALR